MYYQCTCQPPFSPYFCICAQGMTPEQAAERFYILDADGLVTRKRGAALPENVRPYARHEEDLEGLRLEDVVKHVRLLLCAWSHFQSPGPG